MKSAGMLAGHDRFPRSGRIVTYKAEENRPMLSINGRLGFVPIASGGAWKKVLDRSSRDHPGG